MEVAAGSGAGAGVGPAVPERRGRRGRKGAAAGTVAAVMADELLAAAGGVAVH